jgi:hypothetical protein
MPTMPMFLLLPWLLRQGATFWPSLELSCLSAIALYLLTIRLLPKLGIEI